MKLLLSGVERVLFQQWVVFDNKSNFANRVCLKFTPILTESSGFDVFIIIILCILVDPKFQSSSILVSN